MNLNTKEKNQIVDQLIKQLEAKMYSLEVQAKVKRKVDQTKEAERFESQMAELQREIDAYNDQKSKG